MTEHLETTFRAGVTRFRIPGPIGELMYDDAAGYRYQVIDVTPGTAFSLDGDGNLILPVAVSGRRYPPVGQPVDFGPESWDFVVTGSLGIGVTLILNPASRTNEAPEYEASVVLADLSASDADRLDKYITSGRKARAVALLGEILSA